MIKMFNVDNDFNYEKIYELKNSNAIIAKIVYHEKIEAIIVAYSYANWIQ